MSRSTKVHARDTKPPANGHGKMNLLPLPPRTGSKPSHRRDVQKEPPASQISSPTSPYSNGTLAPRKKDMQDQVSQVDQELHQGPSTSTSSENAPSEKEKEYAASKEEKKEDFQKKFLEWEENCVSMFLQEVHPPQQFWGLQYEPQTAYCRRLAGWMREAGGPKQTENPVWKNLWEFADMVDKVASEVKKGAMGDETSDDEEVDDKCEDEFEGIKNEKVKTETKKMYNMLCTHAELPKDQQRKASKGHPPIKYQGYYNICGDVGLHVVFLIAYIRGKQALLIATVQSFGCVCSTNLGYCNSLG